jgi:adenylate cyclase
MAALDDAVSGFLTNGLHNIVTAGLTLAEEPSFIGQAGPPAHEERRRQLVALLGRLPTVAAVYVGYSDGLFVFAGHVSSFSTAQRVEYGAPEGDSIIVRTISGQGADRQETWWFRTANGTEGAKKIRRAEYDPRVRPWYLEAIKLNGPAVTEPYVFAQSNAPGISAGMPMHDGAVIGFDLTLVTLSHLLGEYKVTPNSIIMVAPETSDVFVESEPCAAVTRGCLPSDAEARAVLRRTVMKARSDRQRLEREQKSRAVPTG